MTNYIPKEKLEPFMWKEGEELSNHETNSQLEARSSSLADGDYILMDNSNTYAKALEALREECTSDPLSVQPTTSTGTIRPLTFREILQARVNDYESKEGDERLRLFKRWSHSCTGVGYKAGTRFMKIVPQSLELSAMGPHFNNPFLSIIYDNLDGEELDLTQGKYNELLTREEVITHPAWNLAVEEDKALLESYADIVFHELKKQYDQDKGMRFWVRSQPEEDELRALFVGDLDNYSDANGDDDLFISASFLRVAQKGAAGAHSRK